MKIARHAQNRLGMRLAQHHRPRQSRQHRTQIKSAVETGARNGVRFTYCGARGVRGGCQDATHPATGRMTKPTAAVAAPTGRRHDDVLDAESAEGDD